MERADDPTTLSHLRVAGADGVHLHAVSVAGSGRLMLFLHGFPECWKAWHRQLAEFARDYQPVALDLRGYNLSDKPDGAASYALPRIADDIRCVLGALSPHRPAILVGHDWGGVAAWLLASESPELLDRMVIINAPHPTIFHRELKHNAAQCVASSYAAFFQLRGVAEAALRAFGFAALRKMIFGTTATPRMFGAELRVVYREAWSRPYALAAMLNYYRNLRAFSRVAASMQDRPVNVPTLVLWGEQDPALRPSNLDGLETLVPGVEIRRHPAATHWIVHEEPEWVNEAIRSFCTTT